MLLFVAPPPKVTQGALGNDAIYPGEVRLYSADAHLPSTSSESAATLRGACRSRSGLGVYLLHCGSKCRTEHATASEFVHSLRVHEKRDGTVLVLLLFSKPYYFF